MHKRIIVSVFLAVALTLGALTGCGGGPSPAPKSPTTTPPKIEVPESVDIGMLQPLSGPLGGSGYVNAPIMAFEDVNREGGIKIGGQMVPVNLIKEDGGMTSESGRAAAEKLIAKGLKLLISSSLSSVTLGVQPLCEEDGIVYIYTCDHPNLWGEHNKWGFRGAIGLQEYWPGFMYNVDKLLPDLKKVVIISTDDATGKMLASVTDEWGAELGWNVIGTDYVPRGTQDFYPVLTKHIGLKPEMVFSGLVGAEFYLHVKQAREMGYTGPIVTGGPISVAELLEVAGENTTNVYINSWEPGSEFCPSGLNDYIPRYSERWGYWDDRSLRSLDLAYSLFAAVEKAQSIEPAKVKQALETIDDYVSPVYGPCVWFTDPIAKRQCLLAQPWGICKIEKGKSIQVGVVSPEEALIIREQGKLPQ